ncbi:MAG: arginine deiminase family protein [Nitrospirota bacterium]
MSFLLCPPNYYNIEYEINPWMDKSRGAIASLARQQWDALYRLLTQTLGITVHLLDPIAGQPDLVFTANAGLVFQNQFFMSRFRHAVRQGETVYYEKWFREHHFQIVFPPDAFYFEGEGDALWVGNNLFLGCGIRTDHKAAVWLEEALHHPVYPLELVDPHFYHLDTCFCSLDSERVLYYPNAFSAASQRTIQTLIPHAIAIEEADALQFGANAIVIGNQIVMNTDGTSTAGETSAARCVSLTKTLNQEGFVVHSLDFSEFIKSGGSAKCLILKIEG